MLEQTSFDAGSLSQLWVVHEVTHILTSLNLDKKIPKMNLSLRYLESGQYWRLFDTNVVYQWYFQIGGGGWPAQD